MKSLAELQAIKEKMQGKVALREGSSDKRVVVGMATCGIAAGARPVLNAFVEQVNEAGLTASVPSPRPAASASASMSPSWRSLRPVKKRSLMLK